MKNLVVYRQRRRSLQSIEDIKTHLKEFSKILCTVNPLTDDLYMLLGNQLYIVPSNFTEDINNLTIIEHDESFKIVALEYSIISQELYCAYESGDIARININNKYNIEYEIIFTHNAGLQCMKLSPDHEIITAVRNDGNVITMMSDYFEIISEVDLYSSHCEEQFVTVGWGRKETQFHGSEGKAAATAKPEQISANESDDGCSRITWRDDGSLFAVSFLHNVTKIRQFEVFNRKGILQYISVTTNGLEECLAWKASETMIATTLRLVNKHVVAFFEKNGLKHSEFLLSYKPDQMIVKDLLWSPSADILAIICEQPKMNNMVLQLWTEKNYHWYLKQTIVFDIDNPLIFARWSVVGRSDQNELILMTPTEIIFCSFNWCVNHSRGKIIDDKAVIGVINGNQIQVTGFRDGIVPPPIAHQTLQLQEPANAIVFAPSILDKTSSINSNMFCTILCNNSVTFFKQITNSCPLQYEVLKSCSIECNEPKIDKCTYNMHHFLWLAEDTMLCSITATTSNLLCVLSLDKINSNKNNHLTIQKTYLMKSPIEHIVPSPDANEAYVISGGLVFKYFENCTELEETSTLEEQCYQVEVIKIDSKHIIIALSHPNCFLIDGKEVAKNITSFYVHSDFLLLSTLQHTLICLPLDKSGMEQLNKHDLTIKPWENGIFEKFSAGISIRRIERGSYIIAAIPQDSKTILQMPRGNLECVQPRALSLHIVGRFLDNCNYYAAFDVMRKQRINLNLIHDHNPQLFMDNAAKFVEEIGNSNWLSLFLTELQNEDITRTMYANCYPNRSAESHAILEGNEPKTDKVDRICKLLRDIMEKSYNATNLIQPILISLVKNQQRQGLEKALGKIKQIIMSEDSRKSAQCFSSTSAEDALKYLRLLVDINVLFDTALGMYDFELTMFVGSKSLKDPKEYIPFLNGLKRQNENYMKYSIDMHLKRYESALEHLSKDSTKFEECLQLICNRKLYIRAMKLFKKNDVKHRRVAELYGEFLLSKNQYQEAGLMFYRSGNLNRAFEAFSMTGSTWQDAVTVLTEMKLSPNDLHECYKMLVERLKAERKYEDAATILKDYLRDAEEAVALLCEGRIWKRAIRIAHDIQRLDLHETHIQPGVKEHAEHVISQLSKIRTDFLRHKSRLASVRAEISAKQTRPYDELICNGPVSSKEVTDFLSDTSSVADSISSRRSQASTASGRSYRSSKNRRKQERKLLNLKEGSMFEDLGLIHALYQIISNAYKERDEWHQLVQVLIHFTFDEYAEKLQTEISKFFQLIESSKSEIWNKSAPTSLTEIEKMTNYTPAQLQEITAPIKLVERYLTHPPENDTVQQRISFENFFKN